MHSITSKSVPARRPARSATRRSRSSQLTMSRAGVACADTSQGYGAPVAVRAPVGPMDRRAIATLVPTASRRLAASIAVGAGAEPRRVSRSAEPVALDRAARAGWAAATARCRRDDGRRDRRRRDRGRRDRVLHAPLDAEARAAGRARPRRARRDRPERRPADDLLRAAAVRHRRRVRARAAVDAQRAFDDAHDLLDLMVAEAGTSVRVERFDGPHGDVHPQPRAGAPPQQPGPPRRRAATEACARLGGRRVPRRRSPPSSSALYSVVPQARIRELLEIDDDRYRAVLSDQKGCANSGLLVQQVLAYLERTTGTGSGTSTGRTSTASWSGTGGVVAARRRPRITAAQVVMCTNGFIDHVGRGRRRRIDRPPPRPAGRRHGRVHGGVRRGAAAAPGGDELHPERDDRRRRRRTSTSPGAPTTGPRER